MSKTTRHLTWILVTAVLLVIGKSVLISTSYAADPNQPAAPKEKTMDPESKTPEKKMPKTERGWKRILTRMQYFVLRQKGTERPFSGKYDKFFEKGVYKCAACGNVVFASEAKYDSGCGWPAFSAPADPNAVAERQDNSHGMHRIEIYCPVCGGHLGHVFTDGPGPKGLRYCINSAALKFEKEEQKPVDPNDTPSPEAGQKAKSR